MQKQYGEEKGKSVFYASINSGKVKGAHKRGYGGAGHCPCKMMKREGGMSDMMEKEEMDHE